MISKMFKNLFKNNHDNFYGDIKFYEDTNDNNVNINCKNGSLKRSI